MSENIELVHQGLDAAWLILTATGILLTQVGFACIEAGAARRRDERTILFKNLLDHSVASLSWYFLGWRIFTSSIWTTGPDVELSYPRILQQFGFEITTSSIVSATVLGRCRLDTYVLFSGFLAGITYPSLAYLCWNPNGPLYLFGYKDFGGGGVVHFFGGCNGFVASRLCAKRVGATGGGAPSLTAIGGLVLYISWFFVNAGSSGSISNDIAIRGAGRAALNTALSAGASSIMGYLICRFYKKRLNLDFLVNSLLGGLIAVTAPCGFINPTSAILIGMLAPWVILHFSGFVKNQLDIDDPLDALSVHGACGCMGTVMTGLLHVNEGFLYTMSPRLLVAQCVGILVVACWALFTAVPFFTFADRHNKLSYTESEMITGLDNVYFGDYSHKENDQNKPQISENGMETA